jgi:hypothetical protein
MLANRSDGYRNRVSAAALATLLSILPLLPLRYALFDSRSR